MKSTFVLFLVLTTGVLSETLKVDLTDLFRDVTHCASGSLYGITEKLPASIDEMVAPLHPNVFVNPAKVGQGCQHGDPGWPYQFGGMDNWKQQLTEIVAKKKAAKYKNIDGYGIWNEPDGTWKSNIDFNQFFKDSVDYIRGLDTDAKIIGPCVDW